MQNMAGIVPNAVEKMGSNYTLPTSTVSHFKQHYCNCIEL